ncbi:MAG: nitrogen fixation protein [Alphaproteobacteria bacterium]|nr:nitrogen fixation protein [Alphaproteobacteria bacterium]
MKVAVTSQNFQTITPHAGKARRFLVYEIDAGGEAVETARLDLPMEMSMHEFRGGMHPLDEVQVLIAGSAGPGFIAKMKARGITAVTTSETDPRTAIKAYFAGTLEPAGEDEGCKCSCGGHR